jgi:hypothetical protein
MSVPFVRFWPQVRWQEMFVIKFSTTKFHKYPLCGSWVFICMMLRRRDRLCDSDSRSAEKRTGLDILHLAPSVFLYISYEFYKKKNWLFLWISVHWLVIEKYRRVLCEVWNGSLITNSMNFVHERSKINSVLPMLAPSYYTHENLADRRESPVRLTEVAWQNSLYCGHTAEFRVLLVTQFLFLTSKCSQKRFKYEYILGHKTRSQS